MESISLAARGLVFPALSAGSGPLVLCLHGFPDCFRSFRAQLPELARRGYRAVAPALRGYAPSCAGALADSHALEAARDVLALLDVLGEERAFLVGHDWGAAVAYLAAALAPQRFRALCTLAVPHPLGLFAALPDHPQQLVRSSYMAAFQLPGAERLLAARDFAWVEALWRAWSPGFEPPAAELRAVKDTLAAPGVARHALAYYRALPRLGAAANREARSLLARPILPPVLGLVGARDGCIDADVFSAAMNSSRFARLELGVVDDVGHFLHQEAADVLNARLVDWLERTGQ